MILLIFLSSVLSFSCSMESSTSKLVSQLSGNSPIGHTKPSLSAIVLILRAFTSGSASLTGLGYFKCCSLFQSSEKECISWPESIMSSLILVFCLLVLPSQTTGWGLCPQHGETILHRYSRHPCNSFLGHLIIIFHSPYSSLIWL